MDVERLVVENIAWLRRKAHLYCPNDFDAEDLAEETIEKILTRVRDKHIAKFKESYMRRISGGQTMVV